MVDPMKNFNEYQAAWMQAWMAGARNAVDMWRHMVGLQQDFLVQAAKHHRDHVEIASGASFTDKYGKRAHDIDPERDV